MGIRMVSGSEIQAKGFLSDPCSDSGGKRKKMSYRKKYLLSLVFGVVRNLTISEYCFSGRRIFSRFKKLQPTAHPNPPSPAQNLKSMSK